MNQPKFLSPPYPTTVADRRHGLRESALAWAVAISILVSIAVPGAKGQVGKQGQVGPPPGLPFPAVADTSILQNVPGNNMGGHAFMVAGVTGGLSTPPNSLRRGLVQFDLSLIPMGSTINSVFLVVNISRFQGTSLPLDLVAMDVPWEEGGGVGNSGAPATGPEATWNSPVGDPTPGTGWNSGVPGGMAPLDFAMAGDATVSVFGQGEQIFSSPAMNQTVGMWVDNPSGNFGWMLKSQIELAFQHAARIDSSESPNPPTLYVDFTPPISLSMDIAAASIAENAGLGAGVSATLTRGGDPSGALTVSLSSDDPSEVAIPPMANFQVGSATSDPFLIDVVDDALLDGTQTVTITAFASGYEMATDTIDVTDHETLTVSIPGDFLPENNASPEIATVSRSNTDPMDPAFAMPLTVTLNSTDESEATVPATVEIPAGMSSVSFNVTIQDDLLLDGSQTLNITASASGYFGVPDSLTVTDYELDYGDAPTAAQSGFAANYPTFNSDDGARHLITGLRLGSNIDNDFDGQPDSTAMGDDQFQGPNPLAGQPQGVEVVDDEDGVTIPIIYLGAGASVPTTINFTAQISPIGVIPEGIRKQSLPGIGFLDAWIDYNKDGDWNDPGEQIATGAAVHDGLNSLFILAPVFTPGIEPGSTFARFRLSTLGGLAPTGAAPDGEVEDYLVQMQGAPSISYPQSSYAFAEISDVGTIAPANSGDAATGWTIDQSLPGGLNFNTSNGEITGIPSAITASAVYTITASNPAGSSQAALTIEVNGPRLIVSIVESSISENGGVAMGTVTLPDGQKAEGPLPIMLASDDTTEAAVPTMVTMLANEGVVSFSITAVDDMLLDETQLVTITA